ncbi:hypothetical protein TWF102_010625 [Orbilia oligospora]|uniref:D-3-phosphoglycerate dehydrogenase n=1 Tax=Orbilia oligospora TaxID=2813651 RepID=A0A7C8J4F6_ORBOL|nr:hypothetical protein TWF102_010625 [Orbilia oligospora]KAF3100485.1 hypothetical protein TWF103_008210 [Orbilia oligospora]KAF3135454.1 hypothetical protein TWF703_005998 [Orbilia oligospora]KAF3139061.1 hypothetical protein TWF594_006815 [Orbilia oligospora]
MSTVLMPLQPRETPDSNMATKAKILIADPLSESGLSPLSDPKFSIDIKTGLSEAQLCDIIGNYAALVVRSETKVTAKVLACAKNLKIVGRAGVGVDNIDVNAATKLGIMVVNSPDGNVIAAAELTLALILAAARNIGRASHGMKESKWERKQLVGVQLKGKVLGIVGFGKVGQHVARGAVGMGMKVIATDPYASASIASRLSVKLTTLKEVLETADFLTLHTPLLPSTKNMINSQQLAAMKPGHSIINVARGGLIDEDALLKSLQEGHTRSAALDVFPQEPPFKSASSVALMAHKNVISTPHLGASTAEAQHAVAVDVTEQIRDVLLNQLPRSAVNAPTISTSDLEKINPYTQLIEKMGQLYTAHFKHQPPSYELIFSGSIASVPTAPLFAALINGLTKSISARGTTVNVVNAKLVAKERGIVVQERKVPEDTTYSSLVTIKGANGDIIQGFCSEGSGSQIVRIGDFETNFVPQGTVLIARNFDRPGMIGVVGRILGGEGLNIKNMTVAARKYGNGEKEGDALMILGVDGGKVREGALREIESTNGMLSAQVVSFDPSEDKVLAKL